jgi:hypothetical protein
MGKRYTEKEHAFWQSLVLPQEETHRLTTWQGKGYRWFRSPNVIPIEHYRSNPGSASSCSGLTSSIDVQRR